MLRRAKLADYDTLLPMVVAFHSETLIGADMDDPLPVLQPLLDGDDFGAIWLIESDNLVIGYLALCFGYSLAFGGRDAFIDELYIEPDSRGAGIARTALMRVQAQCRSMGVRALHLEVERRNAAARRLYARCGFEARDDYCRMSVSVGPES